MSQQVHVTVTFPLGKGPFTTEVPPDRTVGEVRTDAMQHFGVSQDSQTQYYLTHNGERLTDNTKIGEIADHAHGLKFTLVKELIQGHGR